MTKTEFINLISFCILMENNVGILGKAPRYVREKWANRGFVSLDNTNKAKLEQYKRKWAASIERVDE